MNTLAVIIPAYNTAISLERLLQIIQRQLINGVEVIVVDDGSTDDTFEIAQRFESSAIHVVHQEKSGVSAARNRGIIECNAKYIWFVDADDEVLPNAISVICNAINQHPCDCYLFGIEKRCGITKEIIANSKTEQLSSIVEIAQRFDVLFSQNLLNPLWNKVFDRTVIEKHNLRFKKMVSGEDAEFVLRFFAHAQSMCVMTDVLYRYFTLSSTSSTHKFQPSFVDDHKKMFIALREYCQISGVSALSIRRRWAYEAAMGFRWNIFNSLGDKRSYHSFSQKMKKEKSQLTDLLGLLDNVPSISGLRALALKTSLFTYMFITFKLFLASFRAGTRNHE